MVFVKGLVVVRVQARALRPDRVICWTELVGDRLVVHDRPDLAVHEGRSEITSVLINADVVIGSDDATQAAGLPTVLEVGPAVVFGIFHSRLGWQSPYNTACRVALLVAVVRVALLYLGDLGRVIRPVECGHAEVWSSLENGERGCLRSDDRDRLNSRGPGTNDSDA